VQGQQAPPVIVRIVEPPHDPTGLTEVLIGSLGLTGAIILAAIVFGIIFAGILYWFRSRTTE
jgi:membrane protein CcdC involved in cytochrome C biogenesis